MFIGVKPTTLPHAGVSLISPEIPKIEYCSAERGEFELPVPICEQ
jgi:hypothetical protein